MPFMHDKLKFVRDDGGRAAAGYKGTTGDCVCRAIAIALEQPYQQTYDELNALCQVVRAKKEKKGGARTGIFRPVYDRYLLERGWIWTPTMRIGSGCRVHLRAGELPAGRLIVSLSKHLAAVVDGVIHDTADPSRAGTRCVYGYFRAP